MQRRAVRNRPALLIDAMGTLVSLTAPAPRLAAELRRRFGVAVSEAQAAHALRAEIAFYRANMGRGRDATALASLRRDCAAVLRDALPADAGLEDLDLVPALLAALRFAPYPDARPALATARRHRARVIVVSNWDVSLLEVLEQVGLAPLLDAVVTSAAVGVAKPSGEIFRHALALADVPAQRARHVGDSLQEDVAGARASGIEPVLLRRDGVTTAGVTTIATLAQLTWEP